MKVRGIHRPIIPRGAEGSSWILGLDRSWSTLSFKHSAVFVHLNCGWDWDWNWDGNVDMK